MTNTHLSPLTHDPIVASLSPADDRVLLNDWLPPKVGVVPKIRIGRYWINVLWLLPLGFVLAVYIAESTYYRYLKMALAAQPAHAD